MQSLFPGFWKSQTETVSQLNGNTKHLRKKLHCTNGHDHQDKNIANDTHRIPTKSPPGF